MTKTLVFEFQNSCGERIFASDPDLTCVEYFVCWLAAAGRSEVSKKAFVQSSLFKS